MHGSCHSARGKPYPVVQVNCFFLYKISETTSCTWWILFSRLFVFLQHSVLLWKTPACWCMAVWWSMASTRETSTSFRPPNGSGRSCARSRRGTARRPVRVWGTVSRWWGKKSTSLGDSATPHRIPNLTLHGNYFHVGELWSLKRKTNRLVFL